MYGRKNELDTIPIPDEASPLDTLPENPQDPTTTLEPTLSLGERYRPLFLVSDIETVSEILRAIGNAQENGEAEEVITHSLTPVIGVCLDEEGRYDFPASFPKEILRDPSFEDGMDRRRILLMILNPPPEQIPAKTDLSPFFLNVQAEEIQAIAQSLCPSNMSLKAVRTLPTSIPNLYLAQFFIEDTEGRTLCHEHLLHLPETALKKLRIEGIPQDLNRAIANAHIPYQEISSAASYLPLAV